MGLAFDEAPGSRAAVTVRGLRTAILGAALLTGLAAPARASVLINFETTPALPTQPNNFAAAGAMQTYTQSGVFTISGGVVLGNPTFLASFPAHGSPPNTYGTCDFADPSLLQTISLTFPAAETVISVGGVLFNGQPVPEDYTVSAFSGLTPVGNQSFLGVPADSSASGFRNYLLTSSPALPITSVTITTPNAAINGWDFFTDTIQVTTGTATTTPIPEPATLLLFGVGTGALLAYRRLRRRKLPLEGHRKQIV
jgi:hypothetical protein